MPLTTTATTTANGIPYSVELDVADQIDQTTSSLTVTLAVQDSEAESFKADMLGWSEITASGGLTRTPPEVAKWGNRRDLYCVKLDPIGKTPLFETDGDWQRNDDGWPEFDIARYRATFVKPLYQVLGDDDVTRELDRFCVWKKRVTAQNEKIPGGGFKWVDDVTAANRTPVPEVAVRVGRQTVLTCKWIDVPRVDYEILATYCNRINDSDFEMDGTTYETGTLLLTGLDAEPRVNGRNDKSNDITFEFAVRSDGRTWNKFWKSGTAGYVEISSDGTSTGDKPFDTVTFDLLWSFS
jgi:hypothetical protein